MSDNSALLKKAREGDIGARNKIVEESMGLVWSVVRHFSGRADSEDLAQIGAIGLIKAASNFNTDFNVKFSTYAVPMITGEIKRYLRDDGPVKVSRKLKEIAAKGRKCEEILRKKLGRDPKISEISKMCEIEPDELISAFDACVAPESIYEYVYDNISVLDGLSSEGHEENIINHVVIEQLLKNLKPKERQVIILRYIKGKTQTEISKIIGVSQVQVSRIEKNSLIKMKNLSKNES